MLAGTSMSYPLNSWSAPFPFTVANEWGVDMIRALLLCLLFVVPVCAQEKSVVKIVGPDGQGSGVLVAKIREVPEKNGYLSLVATAKHVLVDAAGNVRSGPRFDVICANGFKASGSSHATSHEIVDLSLVWTIVPSEIPVAEIAETSKLLPVIGESLEPGTGLRAEFLGYGFGEFKRTTGRPSFRHEGVIQSDAVLMSGQSGGGMFVGGRLFGIISGGHDWYKKENERTVTWPARCADAELILQ